MTTMKMLSALCVFFLLLVVNIGGGARVVEARPHRDAHKKDYMLFVLGDSFVDVGGVPRSAKSRASRGWYYPYGSSDSAHRNAATGRLSDGLVQSDYLAMMLGSDESPAPYRPSGEVDDSGVNFARPFAGALNGPDEELALARQVDQLRRLVSRGSIQDADLDRSVALVSVASGHDYSHVSDGTSAAQMSAYVGDVTDAIADAVRRLLQDVGVAKVLVNSLAPVGCSPWRARTPGGGGYGQCDARGNDVAAAHNAALRQKLAQLDGADDVMVLDLYGAFDAAARSMSGSAPCCDTSDPSGYCGQEDGGGRALYSVCSNPGGHFYWDYLHPTQAGWDAVMDQLRAPIQDFLAI